MIFRPTKIGGAFLVEPERHVDDRGSFARVWCAREFAVHGLNPAVAQASLSTNTRRGTLRGMHYSVSPHAEAKFVRCVRGAIHDVILDLRPDSSTFGIWLALGLTADNGLAVYVPEGVAHGFQTLEDGSDVLYQMTEFYAPECARGLRWDDPTFGIDWPDRDPILAERDRTYPDYDARARR